MQATDPVGGILAALAAAGVTARADGGELVLRPASRVPAALLAKLRQHKAALLAALATEGGENDKGKKDALSEPAPPTADRASPTVGAAPAADPGHAPADPPAAPTGDRATNSAAPAVADPTADLTGWLGDATTALLDKLHAAGCRPDAVPDGETFVADCPRCGRRRGLAIRDTAAGVPAVRVHCDCGDAALLALDGLEPADAPPLPRPDRPRRKPRPGCCPRCGHDRYRDVVIHGGQSVRRDCARCGFLIGFPLWYGQPDPDLAPGDVPASSAADGQPAADLACPGPAADLPRDATADLAPAADYWPAWAAQFNARLVRAGCEPKIVAAVGEAGRKVLAIEATCPACRRPGALTAWPWSIGMMFSCCRGGCERRAIHDALDAAAPLAESERLLP